MKNQRFYVDLVRMLGFLPRRLHLYKLAFLPKSSMPNHNSGVQINNERLEYLGDAVLDAIVADYLFNRFPDGDEGFMTKLRARIVKRKNLDYLATKMEIPQMIPPEILMGNKTNGDVKDITFKQELEATEFGDGKAKYHCEFPLQNAGVHDFAFRIYPKHPDLQHRMDFPLVKWV